MITFSLEKCFSCVNFPYCHIFYHKFTIMSLYDLNIILIYLTTYNKLVQIMDNGKLATKKCSSQKRNAIHESTCNRQMLMSVTMEINVK